MQFINSLFEHPHKKRVAFYLDELGNAGYIPNYLEYISYMRSAGVAFLQVVQDFGQLERIYEETGKETILANSTTKVFFSGVGQVEAEYASRIMGTMTVQTRSQNQRLGIVQDSVTMGEAPRNLMNPDEIRTMPLGQLIVLTDNVPPILVRNRTYLEQPELQARVKLPYTRPTRARPVAPDPAVSQTPSAAPTPAPKQGPQEDEEEYFMGLRKVPEEEQEP